MPEPIKIAEVIVAGELDETKCADSDSVLEQCARLLDKSYASDIIGDPLFRGADGKYYTVTVEAFFAEASSELVREAREFGGPCQEGDL